MPTTTPIHPNGTTPARDAWRVAVAEIAAKARETLPECHGRVDAAVKLVLAGDVELLADGTATVASQSHGTTQYWVVNGECPCKDFPKAPSQWCKHRIAAGLAKRVAARLRAQWDAPAGTREAAAAGARPALPEAPVSVNVYITLGGRQVQVTLRGTDEREVLARLDAVLARYPLPTTPADAPAPSTPAPAGDAAPTCPAHGVRLHPSTKRAGSWYCPVRDQATGQYCKARR
jgi:hypothetical protein